MNQIILVGRIAQNLDVHITETEKKKVDLVLAVARTYKNIDGIYETDFFDCVLWSNIAETTAEYCKTGDMVGVKGRLQTRMIEREDGTKYKKVEVIAEKITFLASKREPIETTSDEEQEEQNELKQDEKENTKKNSKKKD